ncbi:helix-turn-helix transcriptional regulator [Ruminococcus sp. Marseille-P6503]|uniref:helix-turn-helix domain-containing protein n=1 Tax=Ruminococcus sp. Marseille-P6503 TaxID=2364796 RepID=UPI000F53EE74|nr:helix-turn-helix transcriptional regulator [Ruminococcus sp. Marseille-P6503]
MQSNLYLYPNLVKARKSKMTQSELAKLIGISQQEISRYENGEVKAPINYIIDLANCCGVSVDYILGRNSRANENDPDNILSLYNLLDKNNKLRILERIQTLLELQDSRTQKYKKDGP